MSKKRFSNKTVLISGGAGGCGAAASLLFADEGARVAIVDKQVEAGEALARQINERGGQQALFVAADVSIAEQVEAAVKTVIEHFGPITVLFNHAGTIIIKPFLEVTEQEWDWLMAVNVKSMFLMTKAVLPSMLATGQGAIVCTSSVSAVTAMAMEVLYNVTKGAVHQFARAIAVEFREQGIRCNAVCPGFVRTAHGIHEQHELIKLGVDASDAAIKSQQGRMCEPEEVARAVLFLASDEASFVNGAYIFVDNTFTSV